MSIDHLEQRVIGGYELHERLGVGAMGAVYRARQRALERDVAFKVLPSTLAAQPDYLARFNREAKIAAALEHPHIVPIHDYGAQDGVSYVVMRLLTGGTLAQRLNQRAREKGPLPSLGETASLLYQLAGALDYAHRKSVVHRDIKPNNIMFDDDGTAYLVDFGIARLMTATTDITSQQLVFGTPHYMPPEQWRDELLTPETDQYALGVVIYSMVTGQPPFDAESPHALMYKHLYEEPPPAHTRRHDLSPELSQALDRAIAKTPGERYLTVIEFARVFDSIIKGQEGEPTGFFTFELTEQARIEAPLPSLLLPRAPKQDAPPTPPPSAGEPEPPAVPPPQAYIQTPSAALPFAPPPPSPAAGLPRARGRKRKRTSPLVLGMIIGLILLGLLVCAGLAFAVSRLGLFERGRPVEATEDAATATLFQNASQPAPPDSSDEETDNSTSALPVIGPIVADTPVTPIPLTSGVRIAADNASGVAQIASLPHGADTVRSVAFDNTGGLLVTGVGDGTVRLWNGSTGAGLARLQSSGGVTNDVAVSPDGRLVASAHDDGTVRLWEIDSQTQIAVFIGHTAPARAVAFSPDGSWLLSGSEDYTARIWDVNNRALRLTLSGHDNRVLDVAISPDGARAATASTDGTARVWDVTSGAQALRVGDSGGEIRAVAFSPDGTQLATADTGGSLRLWDLASGAEQNVLQGHNSTVWCVAYSPDGSLLASGGRDNTARLWDAATGAQLAVLEGHGGWVLSVTFSPDGSQLVTGGGDGTARIWDVAG